MQHIQGNGIGLKRPDGTAGKYGFANSQFGHTRLPAPHVAIGQAEVTYVLNKQSVAARLDSKRRDPMRAVQPFVGQHRPHITFVSDKPTR
jgi:hypothetical protein